MLKKNGMQKIHVVHRQGTEEIGAKEFTQTLLKYFAKFTETQSETISRIDNKKYCVLQSGDEIKLVNFDHDFSKCNVNGWNDQA